MKLLEQIKQVFQSKKAARELDKGAEEAVKAVERPYEISTPPPIIQGGVRKVEAPVYTPGNSRPKGKSGRMVKTMPRPLKKMKEAQERVEDA